jgi:hypothetical protein
MVENKTVPRRDAAENLKTRSELQMPMRDHRLRLLSRPNSKNIDRWRLSKIRSPPLNAELP